MSFIEESVMSKLGNLSRDEVDGLDYGAVKVDDEGKILLYNRYEAELAGVAPSSAEGKNFFKEIAPCTNNKLFFGKFQKGVEAGELNLAFNYTFTYKMKPTNVSVQMLKNSHDNSSWIFVKKKAA
jgi:photoactive yellow protein